jgi:antitoxin MazE
MQTSIIQIGTAKGICLSNVLLERYQIQDKVELILEKDCIIIRPIRTPRQNWDKAFALMHENGDDKLLIEDLFEEEKFD